MSFNPQLPICKNVTFLTFVSIMTRARRQVSVCPSKDTSISLFIISTSRGDLRYVSGVLSRGYDAINKFIIKNCFLLVQQITIIFSNSIYHLLSAPGISQTSVTIRYFFYSEEPWDVAPSFGCVDKVDPIMRIYFVKLFYFLPTAWHWIPYAWHQLQIQYIVYFWTILCNLWFAVLCTDR